MTAIGKGTRVKLIKSPKGLVPIGAKGTVEEIAKPSRINISPKYLWVVFDNFKSDHIVGTILYFLSTLKFYMTETRKPLGKNVFGNL